MTDRRQTPRFSDDQGARTPRAPVPLSPRGGTPPRIGPAEPAEPSPVLVALGAALVALFVAVLGLGLAAVALVAA